MKNGKPSSSSTAKSERRPKRVETKIFFVDEAHFRADADLRGKWVLK